MADIIGSYERLPNDAVRAVAVAKRRELVANAATHRTHTHRISVILAELVSSSFGAYQVQQRHGIKNRCDQIQTMKPASKTHSAI